MKRLYFLLSILCSTALTGQTLSDSLNYVYTKTYTDTTTNAKRYIEEVSYANGFGLPIQTVQIGISPTKKDVVTMQIYDGLRRPSQVWLPAPTDQATGASVSISTIALKATSIYNDDAKPYSLNVYENSPLNRVTQASGPGAAWHTDSTAVKTEYLTNDPDNKDLSCTRYSVSGASWSANLLKAGNYAKGELLVNKVTDEGGNIGYTFTDKRGQTILTRQKNGNDNIDTYYVYDDYGNLSYVLPPLATELTAGYITDNNTTMKQYAYIYKYDERHRCVWKKLPGAEATEYAYDKSGKLIFTKDGEATQTDFVLYDAIGRPIVTGKCNNTVNNIEDYVIAEWSLAPEAEALKGYRVTGITLDSPIVYTVNYYDNYDYLTTSGLGFPNGTIKYYDIDGYKTRYTKGNTPYQGKMTGTMTAVLGEGMTPTDYIYTAYYYDKFGNIIQKRSTNQLEGDGKGLSVEYIAYNFTGQPITRRLGHAGTSSGTQYELLYYDYDHAGRLTRTRHRLGDGGELKQITVNIYDEIGRLKANLAGGLDNLKTTYKHNVRSWITEIDNPLFKENLTYGYTGNISQMKWKMDSVERKYDYTYDALSRLKQGTYTGNTIEKYKESFTYDKHGNIKTLEREGRLSTGNTASNYGTVDDITFTHTGNQLTNANDVGANISLAASNDFKDLTKGTGIEYTYNKLGALTKDLNKGVQIIKYNSVNLPQRVDIKHSGAEARIEYLYSASGARLQTKHRWNGDLVNNPIKGTVVSDSALTQTKTTDYVDNIIYENNAIKRIFIDGGYIENGQYYSYITDHLGNNRVVANASGTAIQKTHYYPFGMAFADGTGQEKQPYKYNGKEFDTQAGLNLYDYHARQYEPAIGRFTSIDPHAENYYAWSPYAYCANNPIKFIDPTGMDWWSTSDMGAIVSFLNSVGAGATKYDFRGWSHSTSKPEISASLIYNDETGSFYMTTEKGVKSYQTNLTPSLTWGGGGYAGAKVLEYEGGGKGWLYRLAYSLVDLGDLSAIYAALMNSVDPYTYFDGENYWEISDSGRLEKIGYLQAGKGNLGKQAGKSVAKLYIKGYGNVNKYLYHPSGGKGVKNQILGKVKNFENFVGDNPNITVVNGEIVLVGQGGKYLGKTHNTGLQANDFLGKIKSE